MGYIILVFLRYGKIIRGCRKLNDFEIRFKFQEGMLNGNKSKYLELWERYLPSIIQTLQSCDNNMRHLLLNAYEFKLIGNMKSYSFNLEFVDGKVSNNIKGSALAKDLSAVIEKSKVASNIIADGHYKLRMDNKFCLWICKLGNCNDLSFDFKDVLLNNF